MSGRRAQPDELDALLRAVQCSRSEAELRDLLGPLVRLARQDALTGLANRASFERALDREVGRARRYSRPLTLVICDLDELKARNDRLGHAAGDAALVRVGGALRSLSRASDLAARIGGDEFAVLLPETEAKGAVAFARKLRRALGSDPDDPLRLSIGSASVPRDAGDPRTLFETADRRLYLEKARRGNG